MVAAEANRQRERCLEQKDPSPSLRFSAYSFCPFEKLFTPISDAFDVRNIYPCTHRSSLTDSRVNSRCSRDRSARIGARVHVVYADPDTETGVCVCVRCCRCDHPVVTDGVFPAGGPCVDANLRGGATYRYRSTFPTYALLLMISRSLDVGSLSRF